MKFTMGNDKNDYLVGYQVFFKELEQECDLYAFTVVFKSGGYKTGKDRFLDEYTSKVLSRIRKRVDPKARYGNNQIPFEDFYMYEYDACSLKRKGRRRKVHHIHALIPIRKCQSYRVWNSLFNFVDPKLKDALNAMKKDTVSTWLFEPARSDELPDWIFYMHKAKDCYQYKQITRPAADSYKIINKIAQSLRTND